MLKRVFFSTISTTRDVLYKRAVSHLLKHEEKQAIAYFTSAAAEGHINAQSALGVIYFQGKFVDRNLLLAESYLTQAADQEHANSCHYLGQLYLEKNDLEQMRSWWQKAADLNHAMACFDLGHSYEYLPNYTLSYSLYQKAISIDSELSMALHAFGRAYLKGRGVMTCATTAVRYFEKAAQNGSIQAHFDLGSCLLLGRGIPKNTQRAAEAFFIAAQGGIKEAQVCLDQLDQSSY